MPQHLEHLLREAHRRSLWQVSGGYLVAAWIVYEASVSLTEGLGLPLWVPPVTLILAALGLPIIVATALVQRGGPLSSRGAAPEELRLEGLEPVAAEIGSAREDAAPVEPLRAEASTDPGSPAPRRTEVRPPTGMRRFFTWHKAITGGVLAFAALGMASIGFMGMRAACIGPAATLMCSGDLAEDATLLLADFEGPTPDSDLGDVVTEALRVDLLNSTKVRLADATQVHEALGRMRLDAGGRLDAVTARQLATREGYPAILTGEIARLGTGFVLTAHVVNAADGAELAPFRVTARDSAALIDAVDQLSEKIRGKIGESLKSARAGEPLERITTGSMEALRLYTQAVRELAAGGDRMPAIRLLQEAVHHDPEFAMAWRKLGVELGNLGTDPAGSQRAVSRAFAMRERLPERERYLAEGSYYARTGMDDDRAIAAYERAVERFDDRTALNNLTILYLGRGDLELAEETIRRAMVDGARTTHYVNLTGALWVQRRDAAALAVVDSAQQAFPENGSIGHLSILARTLGRDWEAADSALSALDARLAGRPEWEMMGQGHAFLLALMRGRTEPALRAIERQEGFGREVGMPGMAFRAALARSTLPALLDDTAAAVRSIRAQLAETPLEALPASARPYAMPVEILARLGEPALARQLLAAWEADSAAVPPTAAVRAELGALIALAEGDAAGVERLLPAVERTCPLCALQIEGDLAMRLQDRPRARRLYAVYDTIRPLRGDPGEVNWAFNLARILENSAHLAEADGDTAAAADYYARFIEQWEDADPELQPRVQAARRRLQALVGRGD